MTAKPVALGDLTIANDRPFTLISGPCQMESRDHAFMMVERLKRITERLDIGFIYKTSYDKANRTSVDAPRGLGLTKALAVFEEIREQFEVPVLTDVHTEEQASIAGSVVDVLQIPAFLCRQTDLLLAAGQTGRVVNIKKGQFLAPWDMANVAKKVASTGNERILLTDRGTSFGYNTLVTDFRSFPIMAESGYPVVMDATHSVQQPGGLGGASGGQRQFVPTLARAAVAVGVAALFMETHQDPDNAPSDGPCMVPTDDLEGLLESLKEIDTVVKAA